MAFNRRIGGFLVTLLTATALLYAPPASAQYHASNDRPVMISSTTTTSSAVAVGAIMATVVAVKKEPRTALRHYLRDNEVAIRSALAAGAGREIADVAAFFAVREEDLPAFGRLLRRERNALHLHGFTIPDIDAFVRHIADAMRLDPALRPS